MPQSKSALAVGAAAVIRPAARTSPVAEISRFWVLVATGILQSGSGDAPEREFVNTDVYDRELTEDSAEVSHIPAANTRGKTP
jgi:hypothetical protein